MPADSTPEKMMMMMTMMIIIIRITHYQYQHYHHDHADDDEHHHHHRHHFYHNDCLAVTVSSMAVMTTIMMMLMMLMMMISTTTSSTSDRLRPSRSSTIRASSTQPKAHSLTKCIAEARPLLGRALVGHSHHAGRIPHSARIPVQRFGFAWVSNSVASTVLGSEIDIGKELSRNVWATARRRTTVSVCR